MTFNIKKLGFFSVSDEDRIASLSDKMGLGMKYESFTKSEHWPLLAALLNSKSLEAVQQLRKSELTEDERVKANHRAELIEEIFSDIESEVRRALRIENEIEILKEKKNG